MSSTNKTTNYELSQFIGSDKPAWLSDYNGDMGKIDTGIHTAQTTATGADGKADANATKIGTLTNLTTTDKTSLVGAVNEVNSLAGTANTSAGTALSTANSAGSKADSALAGLNRFNLTSRSNLTPSTDKGNIASQSYMRFATDSTSSVYKIYGRLQVTGMSSVTGNVNVVAGTTSLRPSEAYTVEGGCLMYRKFTNGTSDVIPRNFSVGTNGVITVQEFTAVQDLDFVMFYFPPCIYFNSDFGD